MKKRTTIYISEELVKEFQKKCIDEGLTMTAVISELIKEWMKK